MRWSDHDCREAAGITDADIPNTLRARNKAAASHHCRLCGATRTNHNHHLIYECSHFAAVRPASVAAGLKIDMPPTDMAEWVTTVAQIQVRTEK